MRAIVPGHAGARFCKFLEKVSVTDIACKVGSRQQPAVSRCVDIEYCVTSDES